MFRKNGTIMMEIMKENTACKYLSLDKTIAAPLFETTISFHCAIRDLSTFIYSLAQTLPKDRFYSPGENIWIAKSATIAPTAQINAPCIIDELAEIRHCAYIRGSAVIGKRCVVGNSTEIKNSILFDCVQVPHYNYVGDSILGYKAHLGASAITSNVKSDKSEVKANYPDCAYPTGMKKLGAIVGDECEIGCGAVLNPGTVIGNNTTVYPLSFVRGHIPPYTIMKNDGSFVSKY